MIVGGEGNQPVQQGFQQGGLLGQGLLLDVDPPDQFAYSRQGRIVQGKVPEQNLEGDQFTLVGERSEGHVKGQLAPINIRRFPGTEKTEPGLRIDEPLDEPGRPQSVDVRPGPGDPGPALVLGVIEPDRRYGWLIRPAQSCRDTVEHVQGPGGCAGREEIPLPHRLAPLAQLAQGPGQFPGMLPFRRTVRGGQQTLGLGLNLGKLLVHLGLEQLLDLLIGHAFDLGALQGKGLTARGVDLADQPGDVFHQLLAMGQDLETGFQLDRADGRDAPPDAHSCPGVGGG